MTEMLPCPNPDCPYPFEERNLGVYDPSEKWGRDGSYCYQGICPCQTRGPDVEADTDEKAMELAIQAWNKLPRPLVWSKEFPKVPGGYWLRYGGKPPAVAFHLDTLDHPELFPPECEFAGPIPEPAEPEGGE